MKKNAPKLQPKKSDKADLRKWSPLFLNIGLIIMFGLTSFVFRDEIVEIYKGQSTSTTSTSVSNPTGGDDEEGEYRVRVVDPEDLEGAVNAEAATHAMWPGFRGDRDDQVAVRRNFAENFALWLQDNAGQEVDREYTMHIYYGVTENGVIVFYGVGDVGGYTDAPRWLIKAVEDSINKGVLVIPGTGLDGEAITIIYEVRVRFSPPRG